VVIHEVLLGWVLLIGVLTLPVFMMVLRFRHVSPPLAQMRDWALLFTLGYGLSGLGWGLGGVLLFPSYSLAHQLFLVFIIGGHSAGGMTALSSVPSVLGTFLCAMLAPVIVRLCWLGDPVMTAMGIMLLIFGAAMFVIGRHLHAVLDENLRLRFENSDLAQNLSLAKDRAEAASQAKSQFLANMSHELRTPMNGVLGMIEVLSQTVMTDRQRQLVHTAQRSGQNLLVIIEDLLDLSRIEAGKLELDALEFALRDFLDETLALFTESAARKGLMLTCTVYDDVPLVLRGDPVRLRQILVNLVGNAVKFTEQGEIVIAVKSQKSKVKSQNTDPQSCDLRPATCDLFFSVRDTGVGIPEEARTRIFEAFSQADGSTTRRYGGTGLGLHIAKQLAQLMGGDIGVESVVGQGSTFWFTVQLVAVETQRQATVLSVPITRAYATSCLTEEITDTNTALWPVNVLLAEDHPVNQQVARSMLEMLGCRVDVVNDGSRVLEAIARDSYDVIFLDCHMPKLDGFATAQAIRAWETGKKVTGETQQDGQTAAPVDARSPSSPVRAHLPLIALTASAMPGDRERCLAAGMDDYVTKPFTRQQLSTLLQKWLPEKAISTRHTLERILDAAALDHIRELEHGSNANVLAAVIHSYLEHTPQLLETLQTAVAQHDAKALRYAAHTLKSSSANLGAFALSALCKDLEAMGDGGVVAPAVTLLPALAAEYQLVREALSAELQRSA
jgi:signal transduction histidine kinase/CheY-like chemotaxis protein